MPIEQRHVDLALDVKRGMKRLRDLDDADRPLVTQFLRTATDAQMSTLALSREKRATTATLGIPCRVFTPKHSLSRA